MRSGGDKELTLILFDKEDHITHLRQKQSQVIARTIKMILALTEPLKSNAKPEDQNYLLLFRKRVNRTGSTVAKLNSKVISQWYLRAITEFKLTNDRGGSLRFNLSRFRPTKITQMVIDGYDVFDIMSVCGHSSLLTTFAYIDELKTTDDYHRTVTQALERIRSNKVSQETRPLRFADSVGARPGAYVFKGPICGCKNPYDPPAEVKNLPTYQPGDACSYFNMCLKCVHVLITESDLPKLITYRNEIANALALGTQDIPRQGTLYKTNLAILNSILSPNETFTEKSLQTAALVAATNDFEVMDSFVYQATQN